MTTIDQIVAHCQSNFQKGMGAEFCLPTGRLVILVPSFCFSMSDTLRLAICAQDEGFFYWSEGEELNQFELISSGFSIDTAKALTDVLERLFDGQLLNSSPEHKNNKLEAQADKTHE